MKKYVINGLSYAVEIKGNGFPLLLLHGFTGAKENWEPFVAEWSSHFQLVMVDLIGHGETEQDATISRYKIESLAKDLVTLMKEIGFSKFHVVGYSMGGRLALTMAVLYPTVIKRLVLESSSPGLKTEDERHERQKKDQQLAERILMNGVASFVEKWENIPLFATQKELPQAVQQSVRRQRLLNSEQGLAQSLLGMGTGSQPSWWTHLSDIHTPVLLLVGERDKKFCRLAKEMNKKLPDSTITVIKNVGHAIHVEEPKIFGKIVREFLTTT
ncbi:2-succinyl-6-hydroxy-2,4-cyclohexadiene-1-carboxylate synthase [Priestia koreensis]|uniref:Putative 2-succinyl-6-hydroxy-2,4-cyclohexadiene-1-carboxylate synthase n=1 Tax=Priestia koreensis TaxID=284581 RepID=A0A0M0L6P0_9BACI|nr:2-succinyl-6-hydroxy-2,4-cyclohexadiene-1-carboxylate synthase [Priestia koreensis]KOO46745.1 esterase [Priestia koreensis]